MAQETKTGAKIKQDFVEAKEKIEEWDTETLIDSLDQEELPRIVSGGLLTGANLSNFIITRDHNTMSSYMRIGAELGGFMDFSVTKHFAIQPQVIFTAMQNHFAVKEGPDVFKYNGMWSFGVDIPVYFLARLGNMQKGYAQVGGGIFTHFTFASNISRYKNSDEASQAQTTTTNPLPARYAEDNNDYSRLYSLHNNHFGVCVTAGYEFPIGIQINFQYKISLSDIAGFYSEMKGQKVADALIYPQAISLGVGYRWK
jgi:hypothetical protein